MFPTFPARVRGFIGCARLVRATALSIALLAGAPRGWAAGGYTQQSLSSPYTPIAGTDIWKTNGVLTGYIRTTHNTGYTSIAGRRIWDGADGTYAVQQLIDPYIAIGGTTIMDGSVTDWDDESIHLTLPFNFVFYGQTYTSVRISSNGYLTFAVSGAAEYNNDPIPDVSDPDAYIAPWWDDLKIVNYGTPDRVAYEVSGVAPNRVLTVQYSSVSVGGDTPSNYNILNFRVKLYETTGVIDFQYGSKGSVGAPAAVSATCGIENSGGAIGVVALADTPNLDLNDFPVTGTVIRFTPISQTYDDTSFDLPIPFGFRFYDQIHSTVKVSTNGYLTFGSSGSASSNTALPNVSQPNAVIAPLWDDLLVSNLGTPDRVKWEVSGSLPSRVLTVEYFSISHFGDTGANHNFLNFQARLYESTGVIDLVYGVSGATGSPAEISASSGIENSAGTAAVVGIATTPSVTRADLPAPGTTIRFTPTELSFDENVYELSLPFTFDYYCQPYNSVFVSTNGFLNFGGTTPAFANAPLPGAGPPNAVLAPWWDDLTIAFNGNADRVSWDISGSAPDRVATVQYAAVSKYGDGPLNYSDLNFQVRLFETGGVIEHHYGPKGAFGSPAAMTASAGLENQTGTEGLTSIAGSPNLTYASFPASGTLHRFVPIPVATATVTPTAAPCCPGDADNSGSFVDANDFIAVQANFGADNGLGGPGDANCSGSFVDANDFIAVQANFGADCG